MSPEMAEGGLIRPDIRTDIFSLGVILYELITGVQPLSSETLKNQAMHELVENVSKVERPAPSTAYSRLDATTAEKIRLARNIPTEKELTRRLNGRLRHLPMTALRLDRNKRYTAVATFAIDIENYLHDRNYNQASQEPWRDRVLRNLRRYRVPYAAAAIVLCALTLGIIGTTIGMNRARNAETAADAEAARATAAETVAKARRIEALEATKRAQDLIQFLLQDLQKKLTNAGRLDLLAEVQDKVDEYFRTLGTNEESMATLGDRVAALKNKADRLYNQGDLKASLENYHEGLTIARRVVAMNPDNTWWHSRLASILAEIGWVLLDQKQHDEAMEAYDECLTIRERLAELDPNNTYWQNSLASIHARIGHVLFARRQLDASLKSYRDSLTIEKRLAKLEPSNNLWQNNLALRYEQIGGVLGEQEKLDAAMIVYRDSLTIYERLTKLVPSNTRYQVGLATALAEIGWVLKEQKQYELALKSYRDSIVISEYLTKLDPSNTFWQWDLEESYIGIGDVLKAQGQHDAALKSYLDSLAVRKQLVKRDPSNTEEQDYLASGYDLIGNELKAQEQYDEAIKAYHDSLTIREPLAKQEPDNAEWQQNLAETYNNLADVCRQSGDTVSEEKWSVKYHKTLRQMRKLEMPLEPEAAKMLEELDSRFGQ